MNKEENDLKGKKKKRKIIYAFIFLAILIVISVFVIGFKKAGQKELNFMENPLKNLSEEEAISKFDESFVLYLLYNIGAQNLHNMPFSDNEPRFEVEADSDYYRVFVSNNNINVTKGHLDKKDIIIRTSKKEVIKMIRDEKYIKESFASGNSKIDLVAGKTELFGKGYLSIYQELTSKSVTGSFLRAFRR